MSGPSDDGSHRGRGVVRPPPVSSDASEVDVPRLEPPPPSLEAMVQSTPLKAPAPEGRTWPVLVVLVLLAAAVAAYLAR